MPAKKEHNDRCGSNNGISAVVSALTRQLGSNNGISAVVSEHYHPSDYARPYPQRKKA